MKISIYSIVLMLLLGCSDREREVIQESTEFTRAAVQPEWFTKVDAVELGTLDEVQALWRAKKRCCDDDRAVVKANRVFYKSCYQAIESKPADSHLTPYCLWLMDVAVGYVDSIQLSRYLLKNYGQYAQPTDYCVNCSPGDLIARTSRDVALYELRQEQEPLAAASRLEKLLQERDDEISAWVLGEIYVSLAEIYEVLPRNDDAIAVLVKRVQQLEDNWPEGLQDWRLDDVRSAMRILLST